MSSAEKKECALSGCIWTVELYHSFMPPAWTVCKEEYREEIVREKIWEIQGIEEENSNQGNKYEKRSKK